MIRIGLEALPGSIGSDVARGVAWDVAWDVGMNWDLAALPPLQN